VSLLLSAIAGVVLMTVGGMIQMLLLLLLLLVVAAVKEEEVATVFKRANAYSRVHGMHWDGIMRLLVASKRSPDRSSTNDFLSGSAPNLSL